MDQGVSHTPVRGGLIPQLSYNTHGFSGKGGTEGKGREGEREGERRREGKKPQVLVDTPMFQILKNTLLLEGHPLTRLPCLVDVCYCNRELDEQKITESTL